MSRLQMTLAGMARRLDSHLWVVDLLILALLATFTASAVDSLLARTLSEAFESAVSPDPIETRGAHVEASPVRHQPVDGTPILARNIFDSTTGPLVGEAASLVEPQEQPQEALPTYTGPCAAPLSLKASYCSAHHPQFSFVAVHDGESTQILDVGDEIAGLTLIDVGWHLAVLADPAGRVCTLDVWEKDGPATKPKQDKGGALGPKQLAKLVASSIKKISPTRVQVNAQLLAYLAKNRQGLVGSARLTPNTGVKSGTGFQLAGVKKGGFWGRLGVRDGDVILGAGGTALDEPEDLYQAVLAARPGHPVGLELYSKGKTTTLLIEVK